MQDAPTSLLVFIPFPSDTGYAIARYEQALFEAGRLVTGDAGRVHFAYAKLVAGQPSRLPIDTGNRFELDPRDPVSVARAAQRIEVGGISAFVGVDVPTEGFPFGVLRRAGVRTIVAYYGAPMSDLNRGLKLWLKRLEMRLRRDLPDHYIFESEAMRRTAVEGRGIRADATSVVYLGVDPDRFTPTRSNVHYAHDLFGIPRVRSIVFYSGHMESRKGVDVIVRAALELVVRRGRNDVQFLLAGNRDGEEQRYLTLLRGTPAEGHVRFVGYRDDLPEIEAACRIGVIASTGWDSLTYSAIEMAASGLPIIVSRLQGLVETVEDGRTGFLFQPGDPDELSDRIEQLLDDSRLRAEMSARARERILGAFTYEHQVRGLVGVLARAHGHARTAKAIVQR
jgi:glycosyltransferase involved in cell wall biosynthesis